MNWQGLQRLLLAAVLGAAALACATPPAAAQWGGHGPGYFFLRDPFGPEVRRRPPQQRPALPRQSLPARPAPQEPEGGTIYGSSDAADRHRAKPAEHYVIVMGDSLADQLAQGLADAFFEEYPNVAVVKKTRGSSGLVRADFYDWPAEAPEQLEGEKVNAIVIMLGANDRQTLRDEKGSYEIRSDRWRELYAERVDALLDSLLPRGVPIVVVGQPSMAHSRLHADMPYINEILRERAQAKGVLYVDVWDGFVNEQDEFITVGPALDGQTRRLRIADGVHFTRVGARKLAHYVERDLVRLFSGRETAPVIPQDEPEPAPMGRPVAGPVVPLTQPAGPVDQLAGAAEPPRNGNGIVSRVLQEGLPPQPVSGRADDFRWPRSEVKIEPYEPPAPSTAAVPGAKADDGETAAEPAPSASPPGAETAPAAEVKENTPVSNAKGSLPAVITPSRNGPQIITVPEAQRGR